MKKCFLFDLDSTITKQEILPTIATEIGRGEEMRQLTESVMMGEVPFDSSFKARVKILQNIPVSRVSKRVKEIQLSDKIVKFIKENLDQCYVVTSNLDVWICKLIEKIGIDKKHLYCSEATVRDDKIVNINKIFQKEMAIKELQNKATIAIGDGSNDFHLLKNADIGISYGGVRNISPKLFDVCDYAVYDEDKLCKLLNAIKDEK